MTQRKMTDDESRVMEILRRCVGRKCAVTRVTLESRLDLHERYIREIIRSLKHDHGILICSSPTGGYFLPESIEEIRRCRNIELAREKSVRETRQDYDRMLNAAGDQQVEMGF